MDALMSYLKNQWDRVGALSCVAAGAVAMLVGYLGVSSTVETSRQIPYVVSGGLGGIFLLGVGAMLSLSADLRDEWRKLDVIHRCLVVGDRPPEAGGASPPRADRAGAARTNTQGARKEISLR